MNSCSSGSGSSGIVFKRVCYVSAPTKLCVQDFAGLKRAGFASRRVLTERLTLGEPPFGYWSPVAASAVICGHASPNATPPICPPDPSVPGLAARAVRLEVRQLRCPVAMVRVGAVWSICAPDMSINAVLERVGTAGQYGRRGPRSEKDRGPAAALRRHPVAAPAVATEPARSQQEGLKRLPGFPAATSFELIARAQCQHNREELRDHAYVAALAQTHHVGVGE